MAKSIRAGPTFTQEILDEFIAAVESFGNSNEHPDIAFKQVAHALQKFLHYGMSRFSVETLQNVLDDLIASNRGDGQQAFSIRSLTQLRTVVKMTIMRRDAGSLRASDANSLKYIETFFYCVYCLSEAKRMFDQIYEHFYFTYFDPNGVSRQSTKVLSAQPKDKLQKRDSKCLELEDYSQFGISTLQQMTGSTQHKLRQTVRDIKDVLDRWSELLTDEEPKSTSFDPESEQDLHLLHGVSGSEPILRLVPDLFAKYYKCMELIKQWWVLAYDAYPDVPFKRRSPETDSDVEIDFSQASSSAGDSDSLSDKNEATNVEIDATKVMIIENQKVIKSLQEEIDALDKREEKFEILKETYDKVGVEIEDKKKEQKRLRVERERLNADEKKNMLLDIEENLNHLDRSIRLLEFQQALLFEDFMIHLEIRPSIIRFQDDAKTHLKEAQSTKEKNMAHLQKLRDSNGLSETQKESNAQRRKNSVPTIIHSTYSPNNEKSGSPTSLELLSVKEKDKNTKMGTFTVEECKTMNNQSCKVSRDPVLEKRYQTEKRNETGASRKEYAGRPGQTMSKQRKEDTATAADVEAKEKKSNVLKRANSKQTVEAINLVQNAGSKTVSKKGFAEQEENQKVPNENLRRTYDLSKKTKMDPQRKKELKSSEQDMTPRQKNERISRKDPTTSVDTSLRPLEPENRSNQKSGNDTRHIKKVNSQSSPSLNGQDVTKLQEKKSKEGQTLRSRRPSKQSHGITNQTPAVKSK